jgi:hypothetical protein
MKIEGHLLILGIAKVIYFSFANVKPESIIRNAIQFFLLKILCGNYLVDTVDSYVVKSSTQRNSKFSLLLVSELHSFFHTAQFLSVFAV